MTNTAMPATTTASAATLIDRIRTKQAKVGVIGLGYVGLPLAVEFARNGFDVKRRPGALEPSSRMRKTPSPPGQASHQYTRCSPSRVK